MAFILVFFSLFLVTLASGNWYSDIFSNQNGLCREGNSQSPINVEKTVQVTFEELMLFGADEIQGSLENTGLGVKFSFLPLGQPPQIRGGRLDYTYDFDSFACHWGSNNEIGSEHKIKDTSYPLECQFKFTYSASNTKYSNAIFSVFFQEKDTDNAAYKNVTDALPTIEASQAMTTIEISSFRNLFPANIQSLYRYEGSQTSFECTENVIWTLFKDPLGISGDQLKKFRDLKNLIGNPLVDNNREIQELNGRTVTESITG